MSSRVLGIDIRPDGGFSYVVMNSDNTIITGGVANQDELIRVIKKYRPSIVAVDNIREILELGGRFLKRMSKLPSVPQIIQVTRLSDGSEVKMEDLVRKYLGINIGLLTPEETAKHVAELALRGIGSVVKLFENETKIVVKALISTRQGGQSRRRFERNIAIRVRHIVKSIIESLNKANLDYDVFYHRDSEGVRSALIIVYADKSIVRRFVKPVKSMDVKVTLEQVISSSIKFLSPNSSYVEASPKSKTRLIVGVDPGIVTGLALMSLDGKVLALFSGRNMSRRRVLSLVYEYGTPIIVAADVSKPSDYIKKLSSMIGAVLYHPERDMQIAEKANIALKLSEKDNIKVKTPHERDALAAAYKAFISYADKFNKIDEVLSELPIQVNADEVKELVVRGLSIRDALSRVLSRSINQECKAEVIVKNQQQECKCSDEVKELKDYINVLEEKISKLEDENIKLKDEVNRLYTLKYSPPDQSLTSKIRLLESRIELETKRIKELNDILNNVKSMIAGALFNNNYAFAVRVNSTSELSQVVNKGYLPIMRFQDITSLVDLSKGWSGVVITIDEVGSRAIKQLFKMGIAAVPLSRVLALDVSNGIKVIDMNKLSEYISELKKELNEIDYDTLEDLVNEYKIRRKRIQ
ncbi:DUF460 domain-containing protein [Caldivirga sp. UBA161]|uniref:DUF460 domain-containing protein n=1 Tax=Caldivirga sp. UBA161 TaxID=1915569 RepID=UPI0025C4B3EF|nr:DUF460 domain-containing protein [Caldivirga sp. UBA161]